MEFNNIIYKLKNSLYNIIKNNRMNHIISLGSINKTTGEYVYPKIANKKDEYVCPECNKDLILCRGEIRVHHFRHKVDSVNPCNNYNNPGETQIHRDAKLLMKSLLERKIPISFVRNCASCKKNEEFEIPEISETSKILLEHRFEYNGPKTADVAYIDNSELVCVFEICNTHKTCSENRPEPWFEINALTLIDAVSNSNDTSLSQIQIQCIRCEKCEDCVNIEIRIRERNKLHNISIFNENKINSKTPNQKKKNTSILELLNNNIIIDDIKSVRDTYNIYRIDITHPLFNNTIHYHLKHNQLYMHERKRLSFKGNYSIKDIISWYNSKTEYFKKCSSCNFVLSKVCKKTPDLGMNLQNCFQKYKINDLFCNNKRCSNSLEYGNCEYCNGTGKIINDIYLNRKNEECMFC